MKQSEKPSLELLSYQLQTVQTSVDTGFAKLSTDMEDFEKRIRDIERWQDRTHQQSEEAAKLVLNTAAQTAQELEGAPVSNLNKVVLAFLGVLVVMVSVLELIVQWRH